MAERRMFAKTIIDSDAFLDMPHSTQLLYFHLSMRADDDGFINNPKSIMRNTKCNEDDLKLLITKKFIIPFESGIVVIKHWKIHNYIAKDRYKETKYKDEKALLSLDDNNSYTHCIQPVYKMDTQDRLGKDRLGKDRGDNILSVSGENEPCEKAQRGEEITEIIEYLNNRVGTKYRPNSKETKKHINARLEEGFTVEQFKEVIDKKANQWIGTEMEQYLRPSTLFGTKFESYLNAYVNPIQTKPNNTKEKVTFADLLNGGYINDEE